MLLYCHDWTGSRSMHQAAVALAAAGAGPGALWQVARRQARLLQAERVQGSLALRAVQFRTCGNASQNPLHWTTHMHRTNKDK